LKEALRKGFVCPRNRDFWHWKNDLKGKLGIQFGDGFVDYFGRVLE